MSQDRGTLDERLSAPLDAVADDGFSAHLMARIEQSEQRGFWLEAGLIVVLGSLVLVSVPVPQLEDAIVRVSVTLANSPAAAMAALALTLLFAYFRIFADEAQ
jgi:hypothetical protein